MIGYDRFFHLKSVIWIHNFTNHWAINKLEIPSSCILTRYKNILVFNNAIGLLKYTGTASLVWSVTEPFDSECIIDDIIHNVTLIQDSTKQVYLYDYPFLAKFFQLFLLQYKQWLKIVHRVFWQLKWTVARVYSLLDLKINWKIFKHENV